MASQSATTLTKTKKVDKIDIVSHGDQLIIPDSISYTDAIKAIQQKMEYEEEVVALSIPIDGYFILDALLAFHKAIAKKFSWSSMVPTPGFFGPEPPVMRGIQVGLLDNGDPDIVQVPWGSIKIPHIDGRLETSVTKKDGKLIFMISGRVKRKHENSVQELILTTREFLRTESIYRSKAIRVRFRDDNGAELQLPEPKFLDLRGVKEDELIFSDDVMTAIRTNLFTPIEKSAVCRENGIPFKRGVLLAGPYGTGKCHAKGTPILLHDGTIKNVEDIEPGNLLMGPDSKGRLVESIATGREVMYQVTPTKGTPYVVNASHILSLKVICESLVGRGKKLGDIWNISIEDYLNLSKSAQKGLGTWRTGVEFEGKPVELDPYFLGIWLGDGDSRFSGVTTMEPEIKEYLQMYATQNGLFIRENKPSGIGNKSMTYYLSCGNVQKDFAKGEARNPLLRALQDYNLVGNKHIPQDFKSNSREVRLSLLAGLLDSDGHKDSSNTLHFTFKSKQLADDTAYLCRSLGLAAYVRETTKGIKSTGFVGTYYAISVSGDMSEIPSKLGRKKFDPRKQVKSVMVSGITLKQLPEDDYYGFSIDGDHLYLMGDFTVTHNTLAAYVTAKKAVDNGWTYIACDRADELADVLRFAQLYGPAVVFCEDIDRVMQGERSINGDEMLNLVDGIESKGSEIMVVFTTNEIDLIQKALLRPGRLDGVINVTPPDAKAAIKLMRMYGRNLIPEAEDLTRVGALVQGNNAAAIREIVEKAKLYAISLQEDMDAPLTITAQALIDTANGMKMHLELLMPKEEDKRSVQEKSASILADAMNARTLSMKDYMGFRQIGSEDDEEVVLRSAQESRRELLERK